MKLDAKQIIAQQQAIKEVFDAWSKFSELRGAWLEMRKHVKAINEEIAKADGGKTNESCDAWPAFIASFNLYRELEEKHFTN